MLCVVDNSQQDFEKDLFVQLREKTQVGKWSDTPICQNKLKAQVAG